jgi:hypothetical protein
VTPPHPPIGANDEDYLEVLKLGSFDAGGLQEARVSAADAAAEGQIGELLRLGFARAWRNCSGGSNRHAEVKALRDMESKPGASRHPGPDICANHGGIAELLPRRLAKRGTVVKSVNSGLGNCFPCFL